MARTLYMNDGSTEYVFAGMTEEDVLRKIIYERLGKDCEELYEEVIAEYRSTDPEDYERIADGYHSTLMDIANELEAALARPRLNRKEVERICSNLRREV